MGARRRNLHNRQVRYSMHRDTKLGLAMAILVIGFAAALCFPRQDLKGQTDLPLETATELDVAIGLTNSKVYAPMPEEAEVPEPEEVLPTEPVPTPVEAVVAAPVPEPTPIDPRVFPAERVERKIPVIPRESEPEPVVHSRKYRVKVGDTLSGIALKEMGTTQYGELLKANLDVLRNANELMPGMELVIPIPEAASELPSSPIGDRDRVDREQGVEPDHPSTVPAPVAPVPAPAPRSGSSPRSAAGRFSAPRSI
jgi:nucleoid-associated protein YgaU